MLSPEVIRLCLIVFACRIVDVTLATVRTVVTVQGKSKLASCIAFFEVFLWFMVIREALDYETTAFQEKLNIAFAYAFGYSMGTLIGGTVAKLVPDAIEVQVVSSKKDKDMIKALQEKGYELTVLISEPTQYSGEKFIIISTIMNKQLKAFKSAVYELDEKAFITVADAKEMYYGQKTVLKK